MQDAHDEVKVTANVITTKDNQGYSLVNLITQYFPIVRLQTKEEC